MKRITGFYEPLGSLRFFTPFALPPHPALELKGEALEIYGQAMQHLGKLQAMAHRVPDITRFVKAYVIKEALLSSEIEGIKTTLVEVFTHPIGEGKPTKETSLVISYMEALAGSVKMLLNEGLPISSRMLLAAHKLLMQHGAAQWVYPGSWRTQAVRVGDLVPPLASKVPNLMSDLERFINEDSSVQPLIKAGLAHVQFETIHPFADGNGRIGRLLIVLMLMQDKLLDLPLIYPSYYFKKHHAEYYLRLDRVRTHGDFEGWIMYYLQAIAVSSKDAYERAQAIEKLESSLRTTITKNRSSRLQDSCNEALNLLFKFPVISITHLAQQLGKSYNSAKAVIDELVTLQILQELTKQNRNKLFAFTDYLALLEQDFVLE